MTLLAGCHPTVQDVEGPFYRPDAPWRSDLIPKGERGTFLVLDGFVRDSEACVEIPGAVVDVWQAGPPGSDGLGAYDVDSPDFKFRGRLQANQAGGYKIRTLMPGPYPIAGPGSQLRPKHIHLKVSAPGYQPLTTQIYFNGDPNNENDPFFRETKGANAIDLVGDDGTFHGSFNITLAPIQRHLIRPADRTPRNGEAA